MISVYIGLGLLAALFLTHEVSTRAGERAAARLDKEGTGHKPELGGVTGALLGLLGLLLAFTFSSASDHFFNRQGLIEQDANALGTAWLRAGAFPAPQRDALRAVIVAYTDTRIALGNATTAAEITAAENAGAALHPALWAAGLAAANADRDRTMLILPALNDVIDMHTTRAAAMHLHHRAPVLWLLGISSLAATALLGYSSGFNGRKHLFFQAAFAVLAAGVLWLTIDLDYARGGVIRTDQGAMLAARASMRP